MLTTEQKAWQLHENGVSYGELAMVCSQYAYDPDYQVNGPLSVSMDQAIEILWADKLGTKEQLKAAIGSLQ